MYKRITAILVVTAGLLVAPFTASVAVAEATDAPPPTREVDDNDGFDLGWLGLIGLIGLAGLMRRDRDRHHVDRPVGTTAAGPAGTTTRTP